MANDPINTPKSAAEISLVVPILDEEENLRALSEEIRSALKGYSYELLFVDDGSRDRSFEIIEELHREDPRIKGLSFRKNAGKAAAYDAGFQRAQGSLVATLDGDLQDDPKDIPRLIEKLGENFDLVVGWRTKRRTALVYTLVSPFVNSLWRLMGPLKIHDINCPVRVMRSEVAKSLALRVDLHRYIPLLAAASGFRVGELPVNNRPRVAGVSKYNLWKYPIAAVSFLGVLLHLRFGKRPMLLFGSLGIVAFVVGFLIDAMVVFNFTVRGSDIDDDIPTLVAGVLLIIIGTQFISLGLLAEIILRKLDHPPRGEHAIIVREVP